MAAARGPQGPPPGGSSRVPGSNSSVVLSSDISRRNPQDEYELLQRIGSGTYGDVYKVGLTGYRTNLETSIKNNMVSWPLP